MEYERGVKLKQNEYLEISATIGIMVLLITTLASPVISGNDTINEILRSYYPNYEKHIPSNHQKNDFNIVKNIEEKLHQTVISGGQKSSSWPMFCHDMQRTGRSPYTPVGNVAIEKWKFWMDGMTISSPAIDENGTIYTGSSSDQFLFALYSNGTEKWRFNAGAYVLSSPAIADDGTIYVGANNGKLFAINSNGTQKWIYHIGSGWVFSSPVIDGDGIIYAASTGGSNIVAIYPNGTKKWEYITDDWIYCSPSIDHEGNIYIGSNDGYLYALYPNGTLKWKYETNGEIGSTPSIDESGIIYFGSADGYLYALYPDGLLNWRYDTGYIGGSSPAINEYGNIFVGSNNGYIFSINPDGTENWRYDTGDDIVASPSIDNHGTIYIGSMNGNLYAINNDGSTKWVFKACDKIESSVAIGKDGVLYFGASGLPPPDFYSYLYALEIIGNNSPSPPTITGETDGKFGEPYDYTFVSTDPDGDDVHYYIDWGDDQVEEWIGPYDSGAEVVVSHTWEKWGRYTIKAKAKDIFDVEGEWGELKVRMPINRMLSDSLFLRFLDRFPDAFPILRQILDIFL